VITLPHFLHGDADIIARLNSSSSLNPTEAAHGTYLSYQTKFGKPFTARKRLQLALALNNNRMFPGEVAPFTTPYGIGNSAPANPFQVSNISPYAKLVAQWDGPSSADPMTATSNQLYLPMLWVTEYKDISDSDASDFKKKIIDLIAAVHIAFAVMIAVGAALIILSTACLVKQRRDAKGYVGGTSV